MSNSSEQSTNEKSQFTPNQERIMIVIAVVLMGVCVTLTLQFCQLKLRPELVMAMVNLVGILFAFQLPPMAKTIKRAIIYCLAGIGLILTAAGMRLFYADSSPTDQFTNTFLIYFNLTLIQCSTTGLAANIRVRKLEEKLALATKTADGALKQV